MNPLRTLFCWLTTLFWLIQLSGGQTLPTATPEEAGLSSERLQRLSRVAQQEIDQENLAGVVILVARRGKVVYLESFGMQDREAGIPMQKNSLLRIASMTKPITSLAVMMLYEEGHFMLNDPVSKYIPAFNNPTVLVTERGSSSGQKVVPAKREITIRHLLTHTSGLAYPGNEHLGKIYAEAGITHGLVEDENTLAEDIPRLARLPLLHHPGEAFTYGLSIDVLGYLVEVVSGMKLDKFFRKRIFEPLHMQDTHFRVPEEKLSRLAVAYAADPAGLRRLGEKPVTERGTFSYSASYPYANTHRFLSGGGGLTSTVPDYYRFTQMMLNEGQLDGVPLLSRKSVELMTMDHVGELREEGFGYGFGVTGNLSESVELGSEGTFYWGSFWYGTFFIDPVEELIGISVGQLHPGNGATLNRKFRVLVEQCIVD